jgi:multidrug efflux system membrane fusion protein
MNRPFPLILALAAAASACGPKDDAAPAKKAPRAYRVSVARVETRELSYAVEAVGTLEAYDVVTVPARVEGTLESLTFDEGDAVTTDQVLAVVDGKRYALELEQSRTAVASAEAAVGTSQARSAQAVAALQEAETAFARRKGLREKNAGWVSEDELTTLGTAVVRCRASLEEARAGEKVAVAQVEEKRAALAIAAKNGEDARVRSPIAGTIERRHVTAGQYLLAGAPIATLVDGSRLRVRFRVGEAESVRLGNGQEAKFTVAAFPGRPFTAAVVHVNATADPVSRMVECIAAVKEPPRGLKPGFFASVTIVVAREGKAVVVPVAAILPTEKGFTAFTIEDGKAKARTLVLGLHTKDGGVEVLSGLAAGETYAVGGAQSLTDGVAVEIAADAAGGGE